MTVIAKTHENNLLCFAISYIRTLEQKFTGTWRYVDQDLQKLTIQTLRKLCMDYYTYEEVIKARNDLFDLYQWDWFYKEIHSRSRDMKENYMDDILSLIVRVVQSEIPVFVTDKRRIPTPKCIQRWLQEQPGDQSPEDTGKAFMKETVIRSMPDIASWCAAPPGFSDTVTSTDHREAQAGISPTKTKEKLDDKYETGNESGRFEGEDEFLPSESMVRKVDKGIQTDNKTKTTGTDTLDMQISNIERKKGKARTTSMSELTKYTQTEMHTRSIDVHVKPKSANRTTQTSVKRFISSNRVETATQTEQQSGDDPGRTEKELVKEQSHDVSTQTDECEIRHVDEAIKNVDKKTQTVAQHTDEEDVYNIELKEAIMQTDNVFEELSQALQEIHQHFHELKPVEDHATPGCAKFHDVGERLVELQIRLKAIEGFDTGENNEAIFKSHTDKVVRVRRASIDDTLHKVEEESESWKSMVSTLKSEANEEQVVTCCIRKMLNTLSVQNFDSVLKKFREFHLETDELHEMVADSIFAHGKKDQWRSDLYAILAKALSGSNSRKEPDERMAMWKRIIVLAQEEMGKTVAKLAGVQQPDDNEHLFSIDFIADLYLLEMLTFTLVEQFGAKLWNNTTEASLVAGCRLLSRVGAQFEKQNASMMENIFFYLDLRTAVDTTHPMTGRLRIAVSELMDQRENNWRPKRGRKRKDHLKGLESQLKPYEEYSEEVVATETTVTERSKPKKSKVKKIH